MIIAVIIDGQGVYSSFGTIVCTVQPQIRNMTSTYTGFGFGFVETDFNDTFAIDAGQIGYAGIYALTSAFSYGQGELRNNIGDSILAVFDNQSEDSSNALLRLLVSKFGRHYRQEMTGSLFFPNSKHT
jgi:hypothetical protein